MGVGIATECAGWSAPVSDLVGAALCRDVNEKANGEPPSVCLVAGQDMTHIGGEALAPVEFSCWPISRRLWHKEADEPKQIASTPV